MADSCSQYVSTDDLTAAKESILHIEHVATSKDANGDPALEVTDTIRGNDVTNTTLDGLFSDIGFKPVNGSFEDGGTLVNRWNVLLYETDGSFYQWMGTLPLTVLSDSSPFDSSGQLITGWIDRTELKLSAEVDQLESDLTGTIPFKYSSSPVAGMEAINSRANNRYRIGTFNTYVGYWNNFSTNGDNGYGINIKYIQEMILRYQLDFCGFQEFQSGQSYPVSCLAIYPYSGAYFGKVIPISDHNGSSKFNYGNAITYNGSVADTSSAVYTAGATTDKRGYIRTVHSVRGISVAVYVTHLANSDATTRQAQMTELAAIVAADSASRVIVMGDFNTSTVSDFSAFTSIGFAMANNNDVNTSSEGTWYIDNILYKGFSSLVLKAAGTPYTYISDHKMFYAEFEV